MLARASRIVSGTDYRRIVRTGRRIPGNRTIAYIDRRDSGSGARFGFIVSKAVGNAVTRNRVRRRLKAACFAVLADAPERSIVFRALPAAATADWAELRADVAAAVASRR